MSLGGPELYASVDLGSHTSILLVAKRLSDRLVPLLEKVAETHLAKGLEGGRFSPRSKREFADRLVEFRRTVHRLGARWTRAGATGVFRTAEDASEALAVATEALDLECEILTQSQEAALCRRAVCHRFADEELGLVDVGGGSTEVAAPGFNRFYSVGAASLREEAKTKSPYDWALSAIAPMDSKAAVSRWIVTGGVAVTLGMLERGTRTFTAEELDGMALSTECAQKWAEILAPLSPREMDQIAGLPPARQSVIVQGLSLLQAVLNRLSLESFTISTWGLRHGLLLSGWSP